MACRQRFCTLLLLRIFIPWDEDSDVVIDDDLKAVAIEFDFVNPFVAFGRLLHKIRQQRLDELQTHTARNHAIQLDSTHFYNCPHCGQLVDQRDARQVFYHEGPGHEPLEPDPEGKVMEFRRRKD